jgi:pimeloyl-ACP methyl ester carboxylesterase
MVHRDAALSVLTVLVAGCAHTVAGVDEADGGREQGVVDAGVADRALSDVSPTHDANAPDAEGVPEARDAGEAPDGAAPQGCIDDVSVGHHVYTCSGIKMDVEIPPECAAPRACGLVVDSHGLTMDAQMEDDNTNMRALGIKYGFIVVQPNANPAPPFSSWTATTDDPVLFAFISTAISALAVDPGRIHMTGFSDGGEATWRFLCAHADLFASVAAAAGQGCAFTGADTPSREIPVLYMHGTRDALVDFQSVAIPLRDAVVAGWSMGTPTTVAQGSGYVRTQWTSANGTVFEFLQHDYAAAETILGGHCFPGSTDPGNQTGQLFSLACVAPNAFTWGEEVMKFFVAHD